MRGGETYDWRAAAPTLFILVLTATCTMCHQDLTTSLAPSQHPSMQPHFTDICSPPAQFHLITISILAINYLSGTCRRASSLHPLRIELPSTSTEPTPLTPAHTQPPKYTNDPWLYPSPPLTKERSSVGRAQAPHKLASRWCPLFTPLFKR